MGNSIFGKHPLTVYRVKRSDQGVLPIFPERDVCHSLMAGGFRSISETTDIKGYGFVTLENHRDTHFGPHNTEFGAFHVFCLRVDTRKVPPAALKELVAESTEKELAKAKAEGRTFLSKDRRREIRDQCYLRLLARMPACPKVVDVIWNHAAGLLYVCDKSRPVLNALEASFTGVFGPLLELEEFRLDSLIDNPGQFLTWLYSRRDQARHYSHEGGRFEAAIEDRVEIGLDEETVKATTNRDDFPEIDAGLLAGKRVTRANVAFTDDAGLEYKLDVSGFLFPINRVAGPKVHVDREEGFEGSVIEAADNIERAVWLLGALVECWVEQTENYAARISDKVVGMLSQSGPLEKAAQALVDSVHGANATMTITTGSGKTVTIGKNAA